jgi:hypothetical protein
MGFERIRPASKHVAAATAHDLAYQFAAAAGEAHDLLDRRAGLGKRANHAIGLLPPQVALMLQAFGVGQQRRVNDGAAKRRADGSHRSPYRFQKCGAGVLHQMPAIGNLHGLGCRSGRSLTVPAAPVARDDADFRMAR